MHCFVSLDRMKFQSTPRRYIAPVAPLVELLGAHTAPNPRRPSLHPARIQFFSSARYRSDDEGYGTYSYCQPLTEKKFFVGKVSGIEVSVDYFLPIFWGIYILWMGFKAVNRTIDNKGVDNKRSSEFWKSACMGVLSCVLSLLAILGHALTQAFVARRCEGGSVDPIVLWPFGESNYYGLLVGIQLGAIRPLVADQSYCGHHKSLTKVDPPHL
eukprot:786699_1